MSYRRQQNSTKLRKLFCRYCYKREKRSRGYRKKKRIAAEDAELAKKTQAEFENENVKLTNIEKTKKARRGRGRGASTPRVPHNTRKQK